MTPETQEKQAVAEVKQPEVKQPEVKHLDPNKQGQEQPPQMQPAPPSPQEQLDRIEKFELTKEGLNELATCINEVVRGKWAQKTIFDALNELVKPVYKLIPEDKNKSE